MEDIKQVMSESMAMIQEIDLGSTSFKKLIQVNLRKLIDEARVISNLGNHGLPDMYIEDIDGMVYLKEDRDNLLGVVIDQYNNTITAILYSVINGVDHIQSIGKGGQKYTEALSRIIKSH